VGPAHPRIKVKHIKNKIHLQYLSIICLWFEIWPTPAKNHCYALGILRDFIVYSNDEKTDMILIFGECRKNAVQPGHV
jgi:hypothetical protein